MYYLRAQLICQQTIQAMTHNLRVSGMISASSTPGCVRMQDLPKEALEKVAAYFQALSEPTR